MFYVCLIFAQFSSTLQFHFQLNILIFLNSSSIYLIILFSLLIPKKLKKLILYASLIKYFNYLISKIKSFLIILVCFISITNFTFRAYPNFFAKFISNFK